MKAFDVMLEKDASEWNPCMGYVEQCGMCEEEKVRTEW